MISTTGLPAAHGRVGSIGLFAVSVVVAGGEPMGVLQPVASPPVAWDTAPDRILFRYS